MKLVKNPSANRFAGRAGMVPEYAALPGFRHDFQNCANEVRTLLNSRQTAGTHEVMWDGKDGRGNAVSGGIYMRRLITGHGVRSGKMLLIK